MKNRSYRAAAAQNPPQTTPANNTEKLLDTLTSRALPNLNANALKIQAQGRRKPNSIGLYGVCFSRIEQSAPLCWEGAIFFNRHSQLSASDRLLSMLNVTANQAKADGVKQQPRCVAQHQQGGSHEHGA